MSFEYKYLTSSLGFLPETCTKNLPLPFANTHLQVLLDNLSIPDAHTFRSLVDSLPLDITIQQYISVCSYSEAAFLYTVLTFITQKYVWGCGPEHIITTLPKQLGLPLLQTSQKIGLLPVLTYASSVLWNWSLKDEDKPFSLDNLQLNYKIMQGTSYEWFFIIHTAIEGICGYSLKEMMQTKNLMMRDNKAAIKEVIKKVTHAIRLANDTLMRMRDHCVPEEFWKFRIYLSGTQNPTYFPDGLKIEGVEGTSFKCRGPTGTQSSLIQAFDVFFSIKHGAHESGFIEESKMYMPPAHRRYLEDLGQGPTLREYVEMSDDDDLKSLFKEGVSSLERFRKSHIGLVHSYVGRFLQPNNESTRKKDAGQKEPVNVFGEFGTGGSNFKILLNNMIHATIQGKLIYRRYMGGNQIEDSERQLGTREFSAKKGHIMTFFVLIILLSVFLLCFRHIKHYLK